MGILCVPYVYAYAIDDEISHNINGKTNWKLTKYTNLFVQTNKEEEIK